MILLYFILGALFMLFAQPIISSLADMVCIAIEMLSTAIQVKTARDTLKIKQMAADAEALQEEVHTNCIGFVAPCEDCYEEGDEEDKNG